MSHPNLFIYQGRVYFGDTDAAGVAYHANYIRWFEAARIEMLDILGYAYADLIADGIGLSPVELSIKYHAPLRFGEHFTVETQLATLSAASATFACRIKREDTLCCSATVRLACIDETQWKPARLPKRLKECLEPLR